jgi:hypothetical protein
MATNLKQYLTRANASLPEQTHIEDAVEQILNLHEQSGGATFSLYFASQSGQRLYSVCIFPERSRIVPGRKISSETLAAYIRANSALLADPRCCIGTWYNTDTDRTYLDISVTVTNKKLALSLARRYNQEGIFDLFRADYTDTGGTGKPPEDMPPMQDRLPPIRRRRTKE